MQSINLILPFWIAIQHGKVFIKLSIPFLAIIFPPQISDFLPFVVSFPSQVISLFKAYPVSILPSATTMAFSKNEEVILFLAIKLPSPSAFTPPDMMISPPDTILAPCTKPEITTSPDAVIHILSFTLPLIFIFPSKVILKLQLYKEERFNEMLNHFSDDCKVVIISDRGVIDNKAYLGEELFQKLLDDNNLKEEDLLKEYDLVIHMITVASDMENRYGKANNTARFEDASEAVDLDKRTSEAWKKHKNVKVVPVCEFLDEKIDQAIYYVHELCLMCNV